MEKRIRSLLVLLVAVLGFAYWHLHTTALSTPHRPATASPEQAAAPSVKQELLKTPRMALDELRRDLLLQPDRRVLMALRKIRELAGAAPARLEFRYRDAAEWELVVDGQAAGIMLRHLPGFAEIKDFTHRYAASLLKAGSVSSAVSSELSTLENAAESMDPAGLLAALRKTNGIVAANGLTAQSLALAARLMTRLAFTNPDQLEISDPLAGDALALLALAQSFAGQELVLEESLLAHKMGYSSHAAALAARAGNEAWQVYLSNNTRMLKMHAGRQGGYSLERYLYLHDLARKNKYNDWTFEVLNDRGFAGNPASVIATGYELSNFETTTAIHEFMPHLALVFLMHDTDAKLAAGFSAQAAHGSFLDLSKKYGDLLLTYLTANNEQLFDEFESRLERGKPAYTGPVLNAETYSAYFKGYLYTSFYLLGLHYLDRYSSVESAEKFYKQFEGAASPSARQFVAWYRNLVEAEQGNADLGRMLEDLKGMEFFGVRPVLRTLEEQLPNYGYGDPARQEAAAFILQRMDSRMWHRNEYAWIVRNDYLFLSRADEVYRSLAGEGLGGSSAAVLLAKYNDDPAAILAVANEESLSPRRRVYALRQAAEFASAHAQVAAGYEALAGRYPGEWSVFNRYLEFLEETGKHEQVIKVAMSWLSKEFKNRNSFHDWKALIAISKAQLASGDARAAWATVQPFLETHYGPMLYQGTRVLIALRDFAGADKLSKFALERYPNGSKALFNRVTALWSAGDFAQVPQAIKNFPQPLTVEDWRYEIGGIFSEQFGADTEAGMRAFDALLQAGIPHAFLTEIAVALGQAETYELAFEAQSRLRFPGPGQIGYDLDAYEYLKQSSGKETALQWLERRIPDQNRNFSSMLFYNERQPDLLWELIPDPELGPHADAVWLYRAAIHTEGFPGGERLSEYYDSAGDSHYDRLGKYLLDMLPEGEIADQPMNKHDLCEAAYYLGIKALSEERYYEAADWFKVALTTADSRSGEYRWAYNYLYVWNTKSRNLDVLAAQNELILGRPHEWQ